MNDTVLYPPAHGSPAPLAGGTKSLSARLRACFRDPEFLRSFAVGVALLIVSLVVNYYAGRYASFHAGRPVRDIILDHLPTVQVDFIFVDGAFAMWAFVCVVLLRRPRSVPFALKTLGLLVLVRSFFIVLTHVGGPYHEAEVDPNRLFDLFSFSGDLFFSGHTGFPFLFALIFWYDRPLRYTFLGASIAFAAAVLLGHLHYSIDVFAAFFITDSVFRIGQRFFRRDLDRMYGRA